MNIAGNPREPLDHPRSRRIAPRGRPWRRPAGRAAAGGLLVAASAVGLLAAYEGVEAGPTGRYVAVRADVAAGQRLLRSDLTLVRVDLPSPQRRVAFTDRRILAGAVTLTGLRAGQLVQSGDVARVAEAGDHAQLSVAVDPGRAMNGDPRFLRSGERVDVIVTVPSSGEALTYTVAFGALVVDVLAGDRSLGGGRLTVVLSVPPADLEPIAGAAATGSITLARTTGLRRAPGGDTGG